MTRLRSLRALVVVVLGGAAWMLLAGPASAHPLGNFTINRFSGLDVSTQGVTVHYVVDMAEIPTFQELGRITGGGGGHNPSPAQMQAYADRSAARLLAGVSLTAAGEPVALSVRRAAAHLRPGQGGLRVLRIEADLSGALPAEDTTLAYHDGNYAARIGWREIVAYSDGGQGIGSSTVPSKSVSDELRSYPKDLLASPLDVTSATVEVSPQAASRVEGAGHGGARVSSPGAIGGSFASLIERRVSPGFLVVAVLLAMGFGALHALGPGHGKTVMAAYLVGAEGRVRHAVTVGVAVSLMHTASVVALGMITLWASHLFPPEAVYPWLSLSSGAVVLGLGVWLLGSRLKARARARAAGLVLHGVHSDRAGAGSGHHHHGAHSHPGREPALAGAASLARPLGATRPAVYPLPEHDHSVHEHAPSPVHAGAAPPSHDHGTGHHTHAPPAGVDLFSVKGLLAVALSGGILPSPTALVVLLGAVALHRIALGVVLVAAFSVGLAAALTGVGVLVLHARDFASRRLSERAGALIPVLSAGAIVAVGVVLTARAAAGL